MRLWVLEQDTGLELSFTRVGMFYILLLRQSYDTFPAIYWARSAPP